MVVCVIGIFLDFGELPKEYSEWGRNLNSEGQPAAAAFFGSVERLIRLFVELGEAGVGPRDGGTHGDACSAVGSFQ